jgi:hypothetical protein
MRPDGRARVADPFAGLVAAVSVGIVDGEPRLALCYAEDREADVDINVVVAEPDWLLEVQGTGERRTFTRADLDRLVDLALDGAKQHGSDLRLQASFRRVQLTREDMRRKFRRALPLREVLGCGLARRFSSFRRLRVRYRTSWSAGCRGKA